MSIAVIVPSRNAHNVRRCTRTIQCADPGCNLLVVWDRSRGNDAMPPADDYAVVAVDEEFVFARSINIGIRHATELWPDTDGFILCNDDALLRTPGGFSRMREVAQKRPEYGIISAVTENIGNPFQMPRPIRAGLGLREEDKALCFVAVYIPRTTIEQVGLLDEEFVAYGFEDTSYCLRVRRAGLKLGVFDGCRVDHSSLKSTFRSDPKNMPSLETGAEIFARKWGMDPSKA